MLEKSIFMLLKHRFRLEEWKVRKNFKLALEHSVRNQKNNFIDKLANKILSYSEKKVHVSCEVLCKGILTAIGEVVAFRVYDSSKKEKNLFQL